VGSVLPRHWERRTWDQGLGILICCGGGPGVKCCETTGMDPVLPPCSICCPQAAAEQDGLGERQRESS
jgi:hypothetical protein